MTSITTSMMEEIAAVGRAEGADLPAEIPQQIAGRLRNSQTVSMSSIVRDRLAGRPTEWDARNGVVGRIGRRHAVPTPINDLITSLIRAGEPPINDPEFSNA